MENKIGVNEWVEMFKEVGLTEESMKKWHTIFESRYPEGHQSFLEWLGLPGERIEKIRADHS